MYHNRKRELRSENLTPKIKKSTIESANLTNEKDGDLICQKLANDSENLDSVKLLWRGSVNCRRNCILELSTVNVIEKWPAFKSPFGYNLVRNYFVILM